MVADQHPIILVKVGPPLAAAPPSRTGQRMFGPLASEPQHAAQPAPLSAQARQRMLIQIRRGRCASETRQGPGSCRCMAAAALPQPQVGAAAVQCMRPRQPRLLGIMLGARCRANAGVKGVCWEWALRGPCGWGAASELRRMRTDRHAIECMRACTRLQLPLFTLQIEPLQLKI